MADIVSIGIAYDTSQLTAGSRQVQTAMQQLTQAEQQAQTATQALTQSNTQAAQAMAQETQAARAAAQATQSMEQAAKQAAQAMGQQLATAVAQAAQAMVQAQREAKQATQAVGGLGSSMQSFGQQVGAFALAQAGLQGIQQAVSTVRAALADLISTGTQIAQLRSSFTAISGSAAAGGREFQFAVQTANRLGLEVKSVAESYRSLMAATRGTTLAGADTRATFVALSNAAQAYGLSTEQLSRALIAMQQIASKGKVSMEELRGQLAEAIPGAIQITARAFGVATSALDDMVGKGIDAATFWRKFIPQLASEVPVAAERAGKGIQQLGNEIYLLKGRIAESGLLQWLDSVLAKLAEALRRSRELSEAQQERVERRAGEALGPGVSADKLATNERRTLQAVTADLITADEQLRAAEERLAAARTQAAGRGMFSQGTSAEVRAVALARQRVESLKQEQADIARTASARIGQAGAETSRLAEINEPYVKRKAIVDATTEGNKALGESIKANAKAQDEHNKAAALAPEIYGKLSGTLKEQNVFLQDRLKINQKALETATEALVARSAKAEAPPAELLAKHAALRKAVDDDTAAIERNKEAISEAEKARTKALHDAETARKKAESDAEEAARKEVARFKELGEEDDRHFEQLTRLAGQYSLTKAVRDEDTASMLAAALATSQYAEKAQELLAVIEAVQKTEAKLPELRSQAKTSAEALSDIERLEKQLEPRRRDMSRAEQLAATRKELARVTPEESRGEVLARADVKIKEALDLEVWQTWSDFATESLDKVGDAITQFAFHGKMTFKEMATSIAEDFFRMSLKMLTETAFSSAGGGGGAGPGGGGWLNLALNAGLKLLGVAGGLTGGQFGMSAATTAGVQADLNANLIGNPALFQHGGPVTAGKSYIVGEAGPELFVPRTPGTVLPHGQMPGGTTVINVNVSGVQDAQSFVASRGAVQRAIAGGVSQAYRGL
jgi:tape measure domain-containing protein